MINTTFPIPIGTAGVLSVGRMLRSAARAFITMPMPRRRAQRMGLLATGLLLAGCTLMPAYESPTLDVPAQWQYTPDQVQTGGASVPAAELGWQHYFADPRLRYLIGLALRHNRDLRMAVLNVQAAQAQYGIQRADWLPSVGASGSMQRSDSAKNPDGPSNVYTAQLGVTAFELDLFGRVRSLSTAALNSYLATEQARNAAHIALIAEVARAYIAQRTAQQAMQMAGKTLQLREQAGKLVRQRFEAGVISAIDLRQSDILIEAARADHAAQTRQYEQAGNALAMLIGQTVPETLPEEVALDKQIAHPHLPVGLSADVLLRRPDVMQSEYALKAANAHIGAARAAFFPRISLTGAFGVSSTELDGLFHGTNRLWSFIPQISLPILDWGRNSVNLDLAWVRKNSAVAQYEKTIQNAFREVADALSAQQHLNRQLAAQTRSTQAEAERLRLVRMRYDNGIASALELLDAERSSYASQQALLLVRQQRINNQIDLYKVLGGGLVVGEASAAGQQTSSVPAPVMPDTSSK